MLFRSPTASDIPSSFRALQLNPAISVTSRTPPTFLVQAQDDDVDSVNDSLAYYIALNNAHVRAELHLYVKGGHAFGLRRTGAPISNWPSLMYAWLGSVGIAK